MIIVNEKDVKPVLVPKETYKDKRIWVKYLITDKQGARKFHMRIFIIEPHEFSPPDQHIYEHEVFVLKGKGKLIITKDGKSREFEIREGDAIFIESNEVHQFVNDSDEQLIFLCVRGTSEIYEKPQEGEKKTNREIVGC
jgi:quercetin dioxygenase-like cupin family protein